MVECGKGGLELYTSGGGPIGPFRLNSEGVGVVGEMRRAPIHRGYLWVVTLKH